MARVTSEDIKIINLPAIGASETAYPISTQFSIRPEESLFFRVRAKVSSVTVTNGITMIVQHRMTTDDTWATAGSVAITGNGSFDIIFNNTASQTNLPLLPMLRVVVTTLVDDAVTVDNVWVPRA